MNIDAALPVLTDAPEISEVQLRTLMARLNPNRVSNRKQGNVQLSYLEAWDVKATLIRVFGFGGFSADVIDTRVLYKEEVEKSGNNGTYTQWKVAVQSTVRLHIKPLNVTFTEAAVGDGSMGDISEALDKALKTASSDALKRCAIYLGTQFGLSLYDNGSTSEVVGRIVAPGQEWPIPRGDEAPAKSGPTSDQPAAQADVDQTAHDNVANTLNGEPVAQ